MHQLEQLLGGAGANAQLSSDAALGLNRLAYRLSQRETDQNESRDLQTEAADSLLERFREQASRSRHLD